MNRRELLAAAVGCVGLRESEGKMREAERKLRDPEWAVGYDVGYEHGWHEAQYLAVAVREGEEVMIAAS